MRAFAAPSNPIRMYKNLLFLWKTACVDTNHILISIGCSPNNIGSSSTVHRCSVVGRRIAQLSRHANKGSFLLLPLIVENATLLSSSADIGNQEEQHIGRPLPHPQVGERKVERRRLDSDGTYMAFHTLTQCIILKVLTGVLRQPVARIFHGY